MPNFILLIVLLLTFSCSGSKKASDTSTVSGLEIADSDEFNISLSEDVVAGNLSDESLSNNQLESSPVIQNTISPTITTSGEVAEYTVAANETLMLVAFKIYGDYGQWKKIAALNQETLKEGNQIREGMKLKYEKPTTDFTWAPEGNPYLIRTADTLGKISNTTYGTQKYWKNIWQNNKPLIKDPNKIFAGFTIYTPIIESREVANNKDLLDL